MTAAVLASAAVLWTPAGASAAGGCPTRLPVSVTVPNPYALSYTSTMKVQVTPVGAGRVRHLQLALYTFQGELLGRSKITPTLSGGRSIPIRLQFPMQVGKYTLLASGEPSASSSCGSKHTQRVLKLRACDTALPIKFTQLPGGAAADYGDFLSFSMSSPDGSLIHQVGVTVSNFAGSIFGSAVVPALFGDLKVNVPLAQTLQAGGYSIFVKGARAGEPATCGMQSATAILTFA